MIDRNIKLRHNIQIISKCSRIIKISNKMERKKRTGCVISLWRTLFLCFSVYFSWIVVFLYKGNLIILYRSFTFLVLSITKLRKTVLSEMPESLVMHVFLHLSKRSFWLYRSLTPVLHTFLWRQQQKCFLFHNPNVLFNYYFM